MRSRSRRSAPKRSRGTVGGMDVEAMPDRGWSRAFDEPIPLPDGGELRTLNDAGRHVDALPRSMHQREEWHKSPLADTFKDARRRAFRVEARRHKYVCIDHDVFHAPSASAILLWKLPRHHSIHDGRVGARASTLHGAVTRLQHGHGDPWRADANGCRLHDQAKPIRPFPGHHRSERDIQNVVAGHCCGAR